MLSLDIRVWFFAVSLAWDVEHIVKISESQSSWAIAKLGAQYSSWACCLIGNTISSVIELVDTKQKIPITCYSDL